MMSVKWWQQHLHCVSISVADVQALPALDTRRARSNSAMVVHTILAIHERCKLCGIRKYYALSVSVGKL